MAAIALVVACSPDAPSPSDSGATQTHSTSDSTPGGTLPQLITKPGTYTAGIDLEPGLWRAMARSGVCEYRTVTDVPGTDNWTVDFTLAQIGGAPMFDPATGFDLRGASSFKLESGDTLQIKEDPLLGPDFEACEFINDDDEVAPPPAGSDVPWRGVERTLVPDLLQRWKPGQFDFLAAVQQRVTTFDESELTEIGLWICKNKAANFYDVDLKTVLTKFAGLTDIQGDYVINTATRHMCT